MSRAALCFHIFHESPCGYHPAGLIPALAMAPTRARTATASASSSSSPADAAAPKLTLHGGACRTTPRSPASGRPPAVSFLYPIGLVAVWARVRAAFGDGYNLSVVRRRSAVGVLCHPVFVRSLSPTHKLE